MRRLVIAALLVSMGAIAEDAAKVEEPAAANVEESGGHKDWPTLDEWSKGNKLNEGTLSADETVFWLRGILRFQGQTALYNAFQGLEISRLWFFLLFFAH